MNTAAKVLFGISGAAAVGGIVAAIVGRRKGASLGLATMTRETNTSAGRARLYRGKLPIEERVFHIQQNVAKGVQDPRVRKLALSITRHCPARDGDCEARAVFDWTAGRVRYSGDIAPVVLDPVRGQAGTPEDVDTYASPQRTLDFGAGDCDDQSALNAALLSHNGIQTELDITSNTGATWDHIFAVARLPKDNPTRRVPVDTTLGAGKYGRWPPFARRRTFPA